MSNNGRARLLGLVCFVLAPACGSPSEMVAPADMVMAMVDRGPGWIDLEGRIIGIDEVGLPGVNVSLCKGLDCKSAKTGAQGEYAFPRTSFDFYTLRVHKDVAPDYATLDFPLYLSAGSNPRLAALLLPKVGAGAALMPGRQSFAVDGTLTISLDAAQLKGPNGGAVTRIAGLRVPAKIQPNFCVPGAQVMATWAFAPTNIISSSAMPLALADNLGLAPGSAISFLEIDSDGRPSVVAGGNVSMDGKRIDSIMGTGVRRLGWLVMAVTIGGP